MQSINPVLVLLFVVPLCGSGPWPTHLSEHTGIQVVQAKAAVTLLVTSQCQACARQQLLLCQAMGSATYCCQHEAELFP